MTNLTPARIRFLRQRDIVNRYAENDRRALPPSGFPVGNITASSWTDLVSTAVPRRYYRILEAL